MDDFGEELPDYKKLLIEALVKLDDCMDKGLPQPKRWLRISKSIDISFREYYTHRVGLEEYTRRSIAIEIGKALQPNIQYDVTDADKGRELRTITGTLLVREPSR